jgi:hypothetical protein
MTITIAAILTIIVAIFHGAGGELTNLRHLREGVVPEGEKLELHATWHLYTLQLFLIGVALLVRTELALTVLAGVSLLGGGLLFLFFGLARGWRTALRHPQWAVLLLLAMLFFYR